MGTLEAVTGPSEVQSYVVVRGGEQPTCGFTPSGRGVLIFRDPLELQNGIRIQRAS